MSKVEEYYDNFSSEQVKTGINKRHHSIHEWLLKFGLKPEHHCLEIGCGIGTQTELLVNYLNEGKITSVDISSESIQIAKKRLDRFKNLELIAADITTHKITNKFDAIILPDVLEHIPIEKHKDLFEKIQSLIKPDGFIFVHIPNPYYLEWCHKNTPEVLQIIDQPIYTDILCDSLYCNNLYIHTLTTYSIWIDNDDYQAILIKPRVNLEYKEITPSQSTSQRIKGKIKRIFKK